MAAAAIADIIKSSLGPVGLDKMLVDDIGVSVTVITQLDKLYCRFCLCFYDGLKVSNFCNIC